MYEAPLETFYILFHVYRKRRERQRAVCQP